MILKTKIGRKVLTADGRVVTIKRVNAQSDGRVSVLIEPGNSWVMAYDLKPIKPERKSSIKECPHCGRRWSLVGLQGIGPIEKHVRLCQERTPRERRKVNKRDEKIWLRNPTDTLIQNNPGHPGLVDAGSNRAERALALWHRWFDERGDPNTTTACFFCGKGKRHADNCIYVMAKELIKND